MTKCATTWRWVIYLTHWTAVLLELHLGFAVLVLFVYYPDVKLNGPDAGWEESRLPPLLRASWCLRNAAAVMTMVVFVLYWTLLKGQFKPVSVNMHGVNWILMLLDVAACPLPVRFLHVYHALLYGLSWMAFSLIYYAAGGEDPSGYRYVYPVLDYGKSPGVAAGYLVASALVGIPLAAAAMAGWDSLCHRLARGPLAAYSVPCVPGRATAKVEASVQMA